MFFIFSDGVTEAGNPRDELFSKKRLEEALSRMVGIPVGEIIPRMMKEIEAFTEGASQTDDITMMIVQYNGPEE
jgi:sigma-B regulation protein RsbU (phosphoserine phosphatase)